MSDDRASDHPAASARPAAGLNPLTGAVGPEDLPPAVRLQVLATEHWSLLSTRALSWNEAFSRATMFLSAVSGAVVALALVAGETGFDRAFVTFATVLLPVVLFLGVATFGRLVEINREDVRWVIGMNRLRHAYLTAAPDLAPYFVTGSSDDEAGIMITFGAKPGRGGFVHEFVTTPGLIAVVNGVVAGALAASVGIWIHASGELIVGLAAAAGLATIGLLATVQYRAVVIPRSLHDPRFPMDQAGSSATKR